MLSYILGSFVSTLTTDDRCCRYDKEKFLQTIQLQLTKKPKLFFSIFYPISEIHIKFLKF